MPGPHSPSHRPAESGRWRSFAVCAAAAALTVLDLSKVNVGLPAIEKSLNAGTTELQLVVAGYALAYGLSLVPAGRLGDIHSRKLMFIIGLVAFSAASVLCALAPDSGTLVVARVIQGFAAGILPPQVLGIIQHLFRGAERGRALGMFGAMTGIAMAVGPALGGLLIEIGGPVDGWRLLFWMNLPLGAIALYFAVRLLPKRQKHEGRAPNLDLVGIALLGVATFALMLPLVQTTGGEDDDPWRWLWLVLSLASGIGFVAWEKGCQARGKSPAVNLALFRNVGFRNGLLVATAYLAVLPAAFLVAMLYLQDGLGLSALEAGLVGVPFAMAATVSSWVGGRMVATHGRVLVIYGLVTVGVGFTLTLLASVMLPAEQVPWAMAAALLVVGMGSGFVITPNLTLTLTDVSTSQAGVAGSMTQVGQRVGNAVGVAVVTSLYYAVLNTSESGSATQRYDDAFASGLLAVLGWVAIAFTIAVVDLVERRRARPFDA